MQSIETYDFKGKRAIIRVDFNVPLNDKLEVPDDTRIRAAIPTIKKVLEKGGSVILMSHLGRPKKNPDPKFSLEQIVPAIEKRLGEKVMFAGDCMGEKAAELAEKISKYARVKLDDSDNAPGWKFSQWEMKGVPLRLEIGPKDLEKNQCVLVRRDTREKVFVSLDELETAIPAQLEALRKDLYERALANREKRTWAATTMDQVKELAKANTGYIKTMWCGDLACEMKMKEEVGLSSRCMPFEQEHLSDVCPCCGKPAKTMVYWGVAY